MANGQGVCTPTRPVTQDQRPEKLNAACRLLLLLLERYQGKNDHAWPGIRRLSEEMGVSRRYCQQCLRKLEQGRWIACKPRWRSDGSQTSNAYWILEKPDGMYSNGILKYMPANGNASSSQARVHAFGRNRPSLQEPPAVRSNAELLQSPRKPADVSTSDSDSLSLGSSTQTKERRLAKSAVAGSSPRKCDPLTPSQATQSVQRALNSRSPNQLSSSRQSGQAHTGANKTTHQEHSSNHQSKKHGKNVSLKNGGWTGGGIKKDDFATKTEARKRYKEAVQRGYVDQSFNTKLNFFCCWAGVVRLLKSGEVVEPGAYFTHLLKNNLTGVFATLADEDHVKKSKIMQE